MTNEHPHLTHIDRLGLVMRQVREAIHEDFVAKQSKLPKAARTETVCQLTSHQLPEADNEQEPYSLVKSAAATLTVVYGGELIVGMLLLF